MDFFMSKLCIIAYITTITSSQPHTRTIGGVTIDDQISRSLLDKHNELRDELALNGLNETTVQPKATYMNKLFHDDGLAALAQNYLNQQTACSISTFGHNSNRVSEFQNTYGQYASFTYRDASVSIGENLLQYSAWPSLSGDNYTLAADQAKLQWWDEFNYYTYDTDTCAAGEQCGHYTQMAWAKTRYVGCGAIQCDRDVTIQGNLYTFKTLIVACNYYPAGNMNNEPAYPDGTTSGACSECSTKASDRDACDGTTSGLCDGCQALKFGACSDFLGNCDDNSGYCPSGCPTAGIDAADYDHLLNGHLCEKCADTCSTCSASDLTAATCSGDGLAYTFPSPSPAKAQGESQSQGFALDGEEDTVSITQSVDWAIIGMCMIFSVCSIILGIGYYLHRKKVANLEMELKSHTSIKNNTPIVQKNIKPDGLETPIMDITVNGTEFDGAFEVETTINETAQ